jgi:hypothetical protein
VSEINSNLRENMAELIIYLLWYHPAIEPFDRLTSDLIPYIVDGFTSLERATEAGLVEAKQQGEWVAQDGTFTLLCFDPERPEVDPQPDTGCAYYTIKSLIIKM